MNGCRLNIPYPVVGVETKNPKYADILMPLYAGPYGELTALATYTYQSVITEKKDKRISDIIECISMVEMKHFHILSKLIHMLGVDPMFFSWNARGKMQWWNGQFALFETNPEAFLQKNIEEETFCVKAYQNAHKRIDDRRIKEILERIILDEEHHIKIFENLLK